MSLTNLEEQELFYIKGTEQIPEPIGKFIIDNMKEDKYIQTQHGGFIHFSEVCRLIKLYKNK